MRVQPGLPGLLCAVAGRRGAARRRTRAETGTGNPAEGMLWVIWARMGWALMAPVVAADGRCVASHGIERVSSGTGRALDGLPGSTLGWLLSSALVCCLPDSAAASRRVGQRDTLQFQWPHFWPINWT